MAIGVGTALVVRDSLAGLVSTIRSAGTSKSASLTEYTKQAQIIGRVYIEDSIAADDVAVPLMGALNQMYVSYVITALHLDSMCVGGRTVRQRMDLVATETFETSVTDGILKDFGTSSLEDIKSTSPMANQPQNMEWSKSGGGGRGSKVVDVDPDTQRLVNGRLVEFSFLCPTTAAGGTVPISAYLYVQLVPYITPKVTCAGFLNVNFSSSLKTRWKQMRAGEISFIKDFIFARDLVERQAVAIKADDNGLLLNMLIKQRNALFRWVGSLTGILPEMHNLANSILIISKNTFDEACNSVSLDFSKDSVRQNFFRKTFTMILVVVDPMYGTLEMYFAGIDSKGSYTFDMLNKVGTKDKNSFDLKQVMQAFSQGMSPKF